LCFVDEGARAEYEGEFKGVEVDIEERFKVVMFWVRFEEFKGFSFGGCFAGFGGSVRGSGVCRGGYRGGFGGFTGGEGEELLFKVVRGDWGVIMGDGEVGFFDMFEEFFELVSGWFFKVRYIVPVEGVVTGHEGEVFFFGKGDELGDGHSGLFL
jgi:hypothetical protein